jgi:STE24 endopeptidase
MSWARAALILLVLGAGAAGILALAARAPAELRAATPESGVFAAHLGAEFSDQQVARHGAYRRSSYVGLALGLIVQLGTLLVLARGPIGSLVERLAGLKVPWGLRPSLIALAVIATLLVVTLPLGYVGFEIGHAWGLSTQSVGGWLVDRLRGLLVSGVMGAIAATAFSVLVRWQPRTWWVLGWIVFSVLAVLLAYVWPLVVAPLFNRFEALERGPLRDRVTALAQYAEVEVSDVLVVDASRRSTIENAYIAGIGDSRRIVLYDTLISGGNEDEAAFVVAHELGHQVENHIGKNLAITVAGLAAGFGLLAWMASHTALFSWAGASGVGDLRALPLLLAFVIVVNLVSLPIASAFSRRFETAADEIAVQLTGDPETAVRVFRRLAFRNLADLRPPRIAVWALFSHPPIRDRITAATGGAAP